MALKANILKTQDWYANTVVPAEMEKLSVWVEEDSAAYKRVAEMHKMHLAELEEQSVLDMLEADQTNKDLGILLVCGFALIFALAPISPMFCSQRLPLPLPSILPLHFRAK